METTQHIILPLWPEGAKGSEGWEQVEEEVTLPGGMRIVRNVTQPSLTVYCPEKPNGAAVIVAPGGWWHFLVIEHEGRPVAEWLAAHGVTAFVLKYRLVRTGADVQQEVNDFKSQRSSKEKEMGELRPLTLADAQQAVRLVRQRAAEWGVDPNRIGFMGFSAGGGVTAQVALHYTPDCRPDFAASIYAAVFQEVQAPPDAPPLFLLCANDDEMATRASLFLYSAWQAVNRPVELHFYAHGGHGFGMDQLGLPCDTWIERFADWMKAIGMVNA
jgi:acetyl esterase/lipase